MKTITITADLTEAEAWALAQFCKRVHFGIVEVLSDPHKENEPQEIMDAIFVIQRSLRLVGYSPR